ncbi:hypothetical protein HETIRDRAFT_243648, partial [Heterobasidion irregulare TC 32-1]
LHSDRGGEYTRKEFVAFLEDHGMTQRLTVHDTPKHNGVAECLNHMIAKHVHALLHTSGLPHFLWGEAARHVVWLKNQTPTSMLPDGATPYEMATGKKPSL